MAAPPRPGPPLSSWPLDSGSTPACSLEVGNNPVRLVSTSALNVAVTKTVATGGCLAAGLGGCGVGTAEAHDLRPALQVLEGGGAEGFSSQLGGGLPAGCG